MEALVLELLAKIPEKWLTKLDGYLKSGQPLPFPFKSLEAHRVVVTEVFDVFLAVEQFAVAAAAAPAA